MAIVENDQRRRSPDGVGIARNILHWTGKNPQIVLAAGGILALLGVIVEDQVSSRAAERSIISRANEEARLATLEADLQATGGVNLVRMQTSFRVTLRESAGLVPRDTAEATIIDNAYRKIREMGCEPTQTVLIPAVLKDNSSQILAPKMYLIGTTKC